MTSALELVKERTRLFVRIEEIGIELTSMGAKQCSKCEEVKSLDEFYQSDAYKDGLYRWCKQCAKEYNRERYTNSGYRQSYKSNRRASRMGIKGTFTDKQFMDLCKQYDNRCLCCGEAKKLTADHVVPLSKGGSNNISNIQPLCRSCNSTKHDHTIDYRDAKENERQLKMSF